MKKIAMFLGLLFLLTNGAPAFLNAQGLNETFYSVGNLVPQIKTNYISDYLSIYNKNDSGIVNVFTPNTAIKSFDSNYRSDFIVQSDNDSVYIFERAGTQSIVTHSNIEDIKITEDYLVFKDSNKIILQKWNANQNRFENTASKTVLNLNAIYDAFQIGGSIYVNTQSTETHLIRYEETTQTWHNEIDANSAIKALSFKKFNETQIVGLEVTGQSTYITFFDEYGFVFESEITYGNFTNIAGFGSFNGKLFLVANTSIDIDNYSFQKGIITIDSMYNTQQLYNFTQNYYVTSVGNTKDETEILLAGMFGNNQNVLVLKEQQIVSNTFEQNKDEISLLIYPNPVAERFRIKDYTGGNIQLVNSSGQIVREILNVTHRDEINVTDLATGLYFVKTHLGTGKFIKK